MHISAKFDCAFYSYPNVISINFIVLQVENFLLTAEGELKLCDFGSSTTELITPDVSWSAQQRDILEDRVRIC